MYNFMCEYVGVSSDMMVNGKVLRKGLKAMLENVPREDFLNILKAQENGWLKIHGNVTFVYANASKAMDLYEQSAVGEEKEIILAQLLRLAEENKNTFVKNNDLEKFALKFKTEKVEEPKVTPVEEEAPPVEEEAPPVEEEAPPVEEEAPAEEEAPVEEEAPAKSRKARKAKKSTEE